LKLSHFEIVSPLFEVNSLIAVEVSCGECALYADDLITLDVELAQQTVVTLAPTTQSRQQTILLVPWLSKELFTTAQGPHKN